MSADDDMSQKLKTIIRYDGEALSEHSIDIVHLASSLMAVGELITSANKLVNDNDARIKVLVTASEEQHCFELNIEFILSLFEQAKSLVGKEDVQSLKDILEWLGFIAAGGATVLSFWEFMKWAKGRRIEGFSEIQNGKGQNITQVIAKDNAVVNVHSDAFKLYQEDKNRKNAAAILAPLKEDGYDKIQFESPDSNVEFFEEDAPDLDISDLPVLDVGGEHESRIRTKVRIKKAVYEGDARWDLIHKQVISASIEDKEWLRQFQSNQTNAPPGSILDVEMVERYRADEFGIIQGKSSHEIVKVHGVISDENYELFDG